MVSVGRSSSPSVESCDRVAWSNCSITGISGHEKETQTQVSFDWDVVVSCATPILGAQLPAAIIGGESMGVEPEKLAKGYDSTYQDFETPLQGKIREEAYGVDIGQHSWVTVAELQEAIESLRLTSSDTLLDFGCGPCGPLTFLVSATKCAGFGVDLSAPALAVGRNRASNMGVDSYIQFGEIDGNDSMPFKNGAFTKVVSFDVVLHLRDREKAFQEIARILVDRGLFLFTDAGVIVGALSDEDIRLRSINGFTQFVPDGYNERLLLESGFRVLRREDRTDGVMTNALGRLRARDKYRDELLLVEGQEKFERQQRYLETVVRLAERKALARLSYLAERA